MIEEILPLETDLDREFEALGKGMMLNNAPKFDPHLYYYTDEFLDLPFVYLPEIMKFKNPSGDTQHKYFIHVFWLLSNLLRARVIYNGWLAIHMSKNTYSSRYMKNVSYRTLITNTVKPLLKMGLLEIAEGVFSRRLKRLSRIRAAGELAERLNAIEIDMSEFRYATRAKEWVELRGLPESCFNPETQRTAKRNKKIEYIDNEDTFHWRENLNKINSKYADTKIDLFVTDTEFKLIQTEHSDGYLRPLDLTKKHITRKFTHESFQKGGRFYGGWWLDIPKEYRQLITIDGVPTVECDYSAMHTTMLYQEAGATCSLSDLYDIPGVSNLTNRKSVKRAMNIMINCDSWGTAINAINYKSMALDRDGTPKVNLTNITAADLVDNIISEHKVIEELFFSGRGINLQKLDSDIAEQIMLHFLEKEEIVLPVHDSFLIKEHLAEKLLELMKSEFAKRCPDQDIKIKTKISTINRNFFVRRQLLDKYSCYNSRNRCIFRRT